MLARILTFLIVLSVTFLSHAQNKNFIDMPYLETTASADTLVTPDRIYFNILVNEKDAKGDLTFEQLQVKMEETLRKLGINTQEDLELSDLVSNFKKYFLKGQDILKTKLYSLVVKDATMAGKVIVALEGLGISNVTLEKFESSKKAEIMLTLKARAIRRSKQYADTMAGPLNQKIGAAIFISDQGKSDDLALQGRVAGLRARGVNSYTAEGKYNQPELQFEKLKFETSVTVYYKLN
ncbi:MAG TPA: SIMPL domain-containing protein [Chryseosolibacter sp.]